MNGKPTEVEATFTREGDIVLRRFQWRGSWLVVEGLGRCWEDAGDRYFNIVAMGGRLFELRLDVGTLRWSVVMEPAPGRAA